VTTTSRVVPRPRRRLALLPAAVAGVLLAAGCSAGGSTIGQGSGGGSSKSITVDMFYPSPPKAMLAQFTKQTGIKVNWVEIGWDDLQTKIAAAASSNTYYADATDVDWSRVGEYAKTGWFYPMNKWFSPASLKADVPQLDTFMVNGKLIGMPFDASFMVTTVNTHDFKKAGISTVPDTVTGLTAALKKLQHHGMATPMDLHLAAAEGLSTCWYQMTAAFGGGVLSAANSPEFTSPGSPGYKAMSWLVNAYRSGLVPKGNIDTVDYTGFTTEMAKNRVAVELCDYSGSVGSIYNVPSSSNVVNQVQYVPTPGATGAGANVANPDGIGIPKTAKNPAGAAEFIKWFTQTKNQAIWAGLDGPSDVITGFPLPMRLSSLSLLAQSGKYAQAAELETLLREHAKAPFPQGAPPWYAQFSNSVYTNIHEAAAGQESVKQAVKNIANQVASLKASG
jgi:multiple sugar transport system substrate-binding protein